jgi:carbon storage regulator
VRGGIAVQAGEAQAVLVLTRKGSQSIMIGDEIEVSVLAIMGEKVRIGIQAPRSVPVFRKEVYVEIHQEEAAKPESDREQVDEAFERLQSADE